MRQLRSVLLNILDVSFIQKLSLLLLVGAELTERHYGSYLTYMLTLTGGLVACVPSDPDP